MACTRISVPPPRDHAINGSLYMVDVRVGPSNPFQYLLGKLGLLHRFEQGAEMGDVVSMTRTTYTFPFDINIEVGDVGGPSAGLALTLGILDILSGGDLTGGRSVAATGTIELDGTVGDVGGVAQKAVAVRRAGATVFFVPAASSRTPRARLGR